MHVVPMRAYALSPFLYTHRTKEQKSVYSKNERIILRALVKSEGRKYNFDVRILTVSEFHPNPKKEKQGKVYKPYQLHCFSIKIPFFSFIFDCFSPHDNKNKNLQLEKERLL